MITKAFISYSFADKNKFRSFDRQLKSFLKQNFSIETYSFVFDFKKKTNNSTLMKAALKKINESDLLLAELSQKAIGIGVEVGYAKAKGKRIIYLHRVGSELSTTIDGVCDLRIEYKDIPDLLVQLKNVLSKNIH